MHAAPFRIPAQLSLSITGPDGFVPLGSAIDLERATFLRRLRVHQGNSRVDLEQRWYAHRVLRTVMVMQLQVGKAGRTVLCHD
jgi:hypothetical protein